MPSRKKGFARKVGVIFIRYRAFSLLYNKLLKFRYRSVCLYLRYVCNGCESGWWWCHLCVCMKKILKIMKQGEKLTNIIYILLSCTRKKLHWFFEKYVESRHTRGVCVSPLKGTLFGQIKSVRVGSYTCKYDFWCFFRFIECNLWFTNYIHICGRWHI